jgi:hypothetical protein
MLTIKKKAKQSLTLLHKVTEISREGYTKLRTKDHKTNTNQGQKTKINTLAV